jgi:hypothetical protein
MNKFILIICHGECEQAIFETLKQILKIPCFTTYAKKNSSIQLNGLIKGNFDSKIKEFLEDKFPYDKDDVIIAFVLDMDDSKMCNEYKSKKIKLLPKFSNKKMYIYNIKNLEDVINLKHEHKPVSCVQYIKKKFEDTTTPKENINKLESLSKE